MEWTRIVLLGLMSNFVAGTVPGQPPMAAEMQVRPDERVSIGNYETIDSSVGQAALAVYCPSSGIVAFSANGTAHVSEGAMTLIGYPTTYTNQGGGWTPGGGTFIAPCTGLYVFTVSFVKDAIYYGGTQDDVFVYVIQNGVSKGYAWSGEGAGLRGTGSHTVALFLNQGDYVQTFAHSDGYGLKRHLAKYDFTGYLVKKLE
ncbi:C1q-like domain-containing protein [Archangium sp.]|uniref:C1q-like domain-containing protein n=1 Tax=Archangium sp. TaxID=1872627 RepID=UPI002D5979EA|nr:hypothetical protein [Archangium sp.]HYO56273.1 hypothetical protein [Archangium sp.]